VLTLWFYLTAFPFGATTEVVALAIERERPSNAVVSEAVAQRDL
jgi:hypothetical protein